MRQLVPDIVPCENQIHQFFHNQKIGNLLKRSNISKEKGISPVSVFRLLFTLAFSGKNLFRTLESSYEASGMGKDTVYRFLNSLHTNWRRFLLLLSSKVINQELSPLTETSNIKVLIADDTLYRRNRSKQVELLSRVYDHTDGRYYRGFRMLILGWSDGISFMPTASAMLGSNKEKHRYVPSRSDVDRRTNGAKRRQEGIQKATDVLVDLVVQTLAGGIKASHLLFDSWFAFPVTIRKILAQGIHTICMLKVMEKIHYDYQGKMLSLAAIYKMIRKRRGRAKILASIIVSIGKNDKDIPVMAKILFVRDRHSKKWLALLSTDLNLADEEIVKIYKRRWDIEVFFKMTKSFLNLAKECQGRSYDALVAHTTVVCCRYIMLALARRMNKDPRTLGSLFHASCDELKQTGFAEALIILLTMLEQVLGNYIENSKELIHSLVERFLEEMPPIYRNRLLLPRQMQVLSC